MSEANVSAARGRAAIGMGLSFARVLKPGGSFWDPNFGPALSFVSFETAGLLTAL